MSLMSLTAVELGKKIKAKEVTVEAAVREALDAVRAKEEQVHSFVTVDEEGALVRAKEVQAQIDAGELTGPLAGVPVAIKDNMCTEGLLTTCSSKILYNFILRTFREDLPAVPAQLWQQRSVPLPLVLTPAVPSVSRVLSVE